MFRLYFCEAPRIDQLLVKSSMEVTKRRGEKDLVFNGHKVPFGMATALEVCTGNVATPL